MKRIKALCCFSSLICVLLVSCGLESYVYLNPAEVRSYTIFSAEITLPQQAADEFRNYIIYYRIYLSSLQLESSPQVQYNDINTMLFNDYRMLLRYEDDDNMAPASIDRVFKERKYYSLNPVNILNSKAGGIVQLDFTTDSTSPLMLYYPLPSSVLNGPFELLRYDVSLTDRTFNNTKVLENIAADIQDSDTTRVFAYVSMYILAFGVDSNYSPLYSRPKHIGVFRLP